MAGLDLHRKIIERTPDAETDQDHLRVLHACFPDMIYDRTDALAEGTPEIPARGMAQVIMSAEKTSQALQLQSVAAVPCNTFHAPEIWDRFTEELNKNSCRVKLIHMIEAAAQWILSAYPDIKRIGLMSTWGTRRAEVYQKTFSASGIRVIDSVDQELVHRAIYDHDWGVKAVSPVTPKARTVFLEQIEQLRILGAEAVILGCTEIPLAVPERIFHGLPLINPVDILADRLIEEALGVNGD